MRRCAFLPILPYSPPEVWPNSAEILRMMIFLNMSIYEIIITPSNREAVGAFSCFTNAPLFIQINCACLSHETSWYLFILVLPKSCFFVFRKCQLVSFVWCFGYILFFRTTHYLGLPKVVPHANAVQLLLTLKVWTF